ncbi:glycerol-3-phosphate responsive antiterminator [Pseudoflavonifractor phocaeensis]|jgi:glycerol uptake operon antiterminator|uniref:glycerol-3-phosphate responsive antiterminator n=1 Tax=Pseudoflavonifractor phocaeensis TaxID=1870988 RepID=UPI0025A3C285|nr:glycerol-3-phosphate responsive antiterminator [Pseudoflavonifractor phocaeensis]MDM8239561.1 glycerol-3-phosphate responsive antiterminator [Pseudoflavonifractor phocaeensis]
MNRDSLLRCFEDNPVILGMTSWDEFPLVKENESEIVFTLFGTVSNICQIVQDLKKAGKIVFVNVDMVDGLASKNSVVDFIKQSMADGIVSSKPHLLRYARENGLFTIHRFFILDSTSWRSIGKQLEISKADIINITPGWTKVISWTAELYDTPIISSGLVCDKTTAIDNLKAGAISICTTNHDVWKL